MIPAAIARSGHVRVGLEDMPFDCKRRNIDLVENAARKIEAAGGRVANASEVRAALRAKDKR